MSDRSMGWVEYGGHVVRRALAEEVEAEVQTLVRLNKRYYELLEEVRRGEKDWMASSAGEISGEPVVTVGDFIQDTGLDGVGANFKGENWIRREKLEGELEFNREMKSYSLLEKQVALHKGLDKEARQRVTCGELFGLDAGEES
jgi:DNA-binding TFAR19-related protein (PDSD5 family)